MRMIATNLAYFQVGLKISVFMAFLVAGGFGYVEAYSTDFSIRHFDGSGLATGLAFLAFWAD